MTPDYEATLRFLRGMRLRGPWTLSAILPNGGARVPTCTFIIGAADDPKQVMNQILVWLQLWNLDQKAGVYFSANPTRSRMKKRPTEQDIAFCQYIAADFDPLKGETAHQCQDRVFGLLAMAALPPTFVWSSGRGVQAMWRLRPAVKLTDAQDRMKVKRAAAGLRNQLGGKRVGLDSTASVEHLFRLPGSLNYPNANKAAAGFGLSVAGDFKYHPVHTFTLEEFPPPPRNYTDAKVQGAEVAQEPPGGWDTRGGLYDATEYLQSTNDTAREGVSGSAIRTARRLRDYGVAEETTFELMLKWWVPRCEYEWDEEELRGKVERAYINASNDAGCLTIEYSLLELKNEEHDYDFG
jgi:hypothetical protein